jgi:AmmeMemoRadiSam system protein A
MNHEPLSNHEKQLLLALARKALEAAANRQAPPEIANGDYPPRLFEAGASFVTLTQASGELRGCIGALEAYLPLVEDVREHAAAAAVDDYRFAPVRPEEVDRLKIEISILSAPQPLEYANPEDLPGLLRPHIDGLTLRDGTRRATFLPQVWEKLPSREDFLNHLCQKMGLPGNLWRKKKLDAQVYQVEEFHEGSV